MLRIFATLTQIETYLFTLLVLEESGARLALQNNEGKVPIQLLLYGSDIDRNSLEYAQAVNALLRAQLEDVVHLRA
jgi:23S rRNA G2445 N2-methylase RlmL